MVFSQAPFSSYLTQLLSCFRPLAPERQCGENVEILKELRHHQGTADRRCVRRPLLASVKPHRCVCALFRQDFLQSYSANEFRMFCLLAKYKSGWLENVPFLSPCAIVQRGNTQIPSLSRRKAIQIWEVYPFVCKRPKQNKCTLEQLP